LLQVIKDAVQPIGIGTRRGQTQRVNQGHQEVARFCYGVGVDIYPVADALVQARVHTGSKLHRQHSLAAANRASQNAQALLGIIGFADEAVGYLQHFALLVDMGVKEARIAIPQKGML